MLSPVCAMGPKGKAKAKAGGRAPPPLQHLEDAAQPRLATNASLVDAMFKHIQEIQEHPAFDGVFTEKASEMGQEGSMAEQD